LPYENLQLVEKKLFKWDDWDQTGTACVAFFSCTLVKDIGKYKKGSRISLIEIDYENGKMIFWGDSKDGEPAECVVFNLELVVNES
jgi:hypothetical protein